MCEMDEIREITDEHGLLLIEDCAQLILAEYKGNLAGTIGDLACFSLQQSKHMFTGDGGVTVINREDLAEKAIGFSWIKDGTEPLQVPESMLHSASTTE